MQEFKPELKNGFKIKRTTKLSQFAEMVLKSGSSTGGPDNKHQNSDQWLYIVSGEAKAIINNKEMKLKAGEVLLIEAGDRHEIINTGTGPLQTLNFYAPPAY
jgi:mannose-6-phosphate isomerase-like protein (cupin superfamily)